jgi:hypothetical protein
MIKKKKNKWKKAKISVSNNWIKINNRILIKMLYIGYILNIGKSINEIWKIEW